MLQGSIHDGLQRMRSWYTIFICLSSDDFAFAAFFASTGSTLLASKSENCSDNRLNPGSSRVQRGKVFGLRGSRDRCVRNTSIWPFSRFAFRFLELPVSDSADTCED